MTSNVFKYHASYPNGKIHITCKPITKETLDLAYSPGVASICREIYQKPETVFQYTNLKNTIAIITNGTAVLGLGNLGPWAARPVMEAKAALCKTLSDLNCINLEIQTNNPHEIVQFAQHCADSFQSIIFEDIKAPECFQVAELLDKGSLKIPYFNDDKDGTAIVVTAALLKAIKVQKLQLNEVYITIIGAGAGGLGVAELLKAHGVKMKHILIFDSQGMLVHSRPNLNKYKLLYAQDNEYSLHEALHKSHICIGLSQEGAIKPQWISKMPLNSIILALANPKPEIEPNLVAKLRPDILIRTSQDGINNILCFPYLPLIAMLLKQPITNKIKVDFVKHLNQYTDLYYPGKILPSKLDLNLRYYLIKAMCGESIYKQYISPSFNITAITLHINDTHLARFLENFNILHSKNSKYRVQITEKLTGAICIYRDNLVSSEVSLSVPHIATKHHDYTSAIASIDIKKTTIFICDRLSISEIPKLLHFAQKIIGEQ